jgi:polysaccharide biosynthesis transport protein
MLRPSSSSSKKTENGSLEAPVGPSGGAKEDIAIAQLSSQLESNRLEVENLTKDQSQLKNTIQQYQMRVNQTPVREQQLAEMLRNYELLKQDYADKLNKEMESQMAANLEKRQEGQQFRVVDRPSLPTIPSSPNRIKISLGGGFVGIGLGLAFAFLRDMRDRSFHSEEALRKRFAVPLIMGIPLLITASEEQIRTRKRALEWMAGFALGLAVIVTEVYEFYIYRHS